MKVVVEDAKFGYNKEIHLFSNLSFSLNSGEILAVLGSNGVGKTTLLKCIMGFLKFDEGRCLINGSENSNFKDISYVPQAKKLAFNYSVIDFVSFGRSGVNKYLASPSKLDYKQSELILEQMGIADLKDKDCNKLSGGELQMVYIAKSLVSYPKVLVLDEPESNLDYSNQIKLLNILKELSGEKSVTIIINSHYLNNIIKIAKKCLILKSQNHIVCSSKDINTNIIEKFFNVKTKEIEYKMDGQELKHFIF